MTHESDFANACLEENPCGILILDGSGEITWLNNALERMTGLSSEQLVGQQSEGFPFNSHQALFSNDDLIHIPATDQGEGRWLECKTHEMDKGSIKYYLDVTAIVELQKENDRLSSQIEELTITDELTGLANRQALTRALNAQVTRSRRYQNPLSLAVMELVDESAAQEPIDDELILTASRYLRDRLRWVDVIARWDHNQFVIILPETNSDDGFKLIDKIRESFPEESLPKQFAEKSLGLNFGLVEWQKGNDARLLMERAAEAMAHLKDQLEPAS